MFDLKVIKSIPCQVIAEKFGIKLEKKYNRLWGSLRNEKEASFSINLKNNLWCDYGSGKGGSVIDLLMELEGISSNLAIKKLAEEFGIEGDKEKGNGWQPLTDNQYKKLGIKPERATMNFKIDLTKHDMRKVSKWEKKYGMPIKELAVKYPKLYNDMISKIATDHIKEAKEIYNSKVNMYKNNKVDKVTKEFLKAISNDDANEINNSVELLQRALTTPKDYSYLKVNPENDFYINKNVSLDSNIDKMIDTYKTKYNYYKVDELSKEQKTALYEVNKTVYDNDISILSLFALKEMYKMIGKKLENMNSSNTNYQDTKNLFNNLETAINGIKQVEMIPQSERNIVLSKDMELSR